MPETDGGTMADYPDEEKIRQVFCNVQRHQRIEQLIRQFSTNKEDIRITALNRVDVSSCRQILELGCAFGAFTEALKGRLHPDAFITGLDMIAEYEPFFLAACARAGYTGTFSSAGVGSILRYPPGSFDLVICSYALYFFVQMIPEIARVLKKDGRFITITHDECNMQELIHITRAILKENSFLDDGQLLPIEVILRQFSADNGGALLAPYFREVRRFLFPNSLIFQPWEIFFFVDYYQFKSPLFLSGTGAHKEQMVQKMLSRLQDAAAGRKPISMCKDDAIFICSEPNPRKDTA
jgi:SAM-dependent methyltransferase